VKTLLDIIAELQGLYEAHGNLQVVKHDCEWGLETDITPKIEKVWEEHGHLVSYSEDMIAERRHTASQVMTEEVMRESYDGLVKSMEEAGFSESQTFEEWREMMLKVPVDAAETVRKYEAAPFMVVV
jgi:hypothetical protein